ncbi:MAG: TetR/AcrR family transcriptional regulator [Rhodospirillaceae bacterium]|nr:TetR/AcrR family transcriptional regulator [Rhodospirillaceae bacterium]
MARTKGSSGARTKEAIKKAGRELIYQHGYEGMNLRQLADRVGIMQGSLYNHIKSKQDLLFLLMREHLEGLVRDLDSALHNIEGAVAKLRAFVRFHVIRHMEHRDEVYINNSELRSLEPRNLRTIVALRAAYERRIIDILTEGRTVKVFDIADPKIAAFVLIAMLTGVCAWYKPSGRRSQEQLVKIHVAMALNAVLTKAHHTH